MSIRLRVIFWLLVGLFVGIVIVFLSIAFFSLRGAWVESALIGVIDLYAILGGVLIYLVIKEKPMRRLKRFLLVTGASAVGVPVSAVWHDEAFFFIMALFVCPIAFVVGVIGTGVITKRLRKDLPAIR